jgi:hypothetical protein
MELIEMRITPSEQIHLAETMNESSIYAVLDNGIAGQPPSSRNERLLMEAATIQSCCFEDDKMSQTRASISMHNVLYTNASDVTIVSIIILKFVQNYVIPRHRQCRCIGIRHIPHADCSLL